MVYVITKDAQVDLVYNNLVLVHSMIHDNLNILPPPAA
jgi:hypothetical protein